MDNHNPAARSPFKDLTNMPVHANANPMSENLREQNSKGAQSWYARLSDEKRAEYNQKRRALYKEKKAAALISRDHEQVSQTHASSLLGVQRTPLSNITNTLDNGICTTATSASTDHPTEDMNVGCKKRTGQGWYARLSKEKKAEHCYKLRMARLQKKAQDLNVNADEPHYQPLQLSTGTNCTAASSVSADHQPVENNVGRDRQSGHGWYATLSDDKKEDSRKKLLISRLEKKSAHIDVQLAPGIGQLESAQSGVSQMLNTPCSGSAMEEDCDIDWLYNNPTYQRQTIDVRDVSDMSVAEGMHGQESYLPNLVASSEKKRGRMKEKYAGMTAEEKDIVLRRKRAYKMGIRHTVALSDQSDIAEAASGSAIPSSSTPAIYGQPFGQYNRSGGNNNDEESDVAGILEPTEPSAEKEESLHNIQDGQPMYGDDEECRIFSGQGDQFESYRVTPDGSHAFETHDPYDYVYKNLPTRHHVLKPVKDCVYCGAMRF